MLPEFEPGSRVIADSRAFLKRNPERGDVVVASLPGLSGEAIKRVVGISGDRIAITNGRLWINGSIQSDSVFYGSEGDWQVPRNHVFLLGDNPESSTDSRKIGPIPKEKLVGKVWVKYWPVPARRKQSLARTVM